MSTPDLIGSAVRNREHVIITKWGFDWPWRRGRRGTRGGLDAGAALLAGASLLLAADAAAMGVVSWHAQYVFVFGAKHQHMASALEALGLDASAVIFALLGIALARLRRRAAIERVLVVACAGGSCAMNLLGANLGSPRSVAVYVMPPALFAAGSDRLVAVIRRAAMGRREDDCAQHSAWRAAGLAVLYGLRLVVAPPSTLAGARRALLAATPLPGLAAPAGTKAIEPPLPGGRDRPHPGPREGTKTARFLALVVDRYGPLPGFDLGKVSRAAAELAPEAGLHAGSARAALRSAVLAAQAGGAE